MAQIVIQPEGAYVNVDGRLVPLDGAIVFITPDHGSGQGVTLRFPPNDVTIVGAPVNALLYDFRGQILRLAIAVARGGLTIAEINAVAPARAAAVQNLLTSNGWSPGSVE